MRASRNTPPTPPMEQGEPRRGSPMDRPTLGPRLLGLPPAKGTEAGRDEGDIAMQTASPLPLAEDVHPPETAADTLPTANR